MTTHSSRSIPGPAYPWTYRVAQNPRLLVALALAGAFIVISAVPLYSVDPRWFVSLVNPGSVIGVETPHPATVLAALGLAAQVLLVPSVTGWHHMGTPPRIDGVEKRIPAHSLWRLHIPGLAVFVLLGSAFLLLADMLRDDYAGKELASFRFLVLATLSFFIVAGSVAFAGHRRSLIFTPHALHYTRGRFRAVIPWDSVANLRPVCDANAKGGGQGRVDHPSHHNVRAGVQLMLKHPVDTRGKTMRFRMAGRDVIGIDCSSYKIDPNTLINAIYLLVENPGLRPMLDSPEGAELFVGPDWNTRRTMRVGDRWDRSTGAIIRADRPRADTQGVS